MLNVVVTKQKNNITKSLSSSIALTRWFDENKSDFSLLATGSTASRCTAIHSTTATDSCTSSKAFGHCWSENGHTNDDLSSHCILLPITHRRCQSSFNSHIWQQFPWLVSISSGQDWARDNPSPVSTLVCLLPIPSYTDLPSPDLVAAQGALVSVGSSYVTYIDKKGQVRVRFEYTMQK